MMYIPHDIAKAQMLVTLPTKLVDRFRHIFSERDLIFQVPLKYNHMDKNFCTVLAQRTFKSGQFIRGKLMDRLHYGQNFEKRSSGKFHCHSIEEHPKASKIAKFGREML